MRLEIILYYISIEWPIYLLSLLLCTIVCYCYFKNKINTLLDPFFFRALGVVFANTIPVFMFLCGIIRTDYFLFFIVIELSFWIGFSRNKKPQKIGLIHTEQINYKLFLVSFATIVLFKSFFYINYGIPLLMENRSDKYMGDAAGTGWMDRLTYIIEIFCAIYSISNLSNGSKKKLLSILFLFIYIMICFFEGSKSAILLLVGPIYFYFYFIKQKPVKIVKIFFFFFLVLSGSIIVILIQGDNNAIIHLVRRFMMFGDVYYEAYGYDTIKEVVIKHPINDLLVNILAPFRLMDYNIGVDIAPSIQVHRANYPELEDINGGPNNRVPFLYYCLFGGWISILFAFITGWFSSAIMYKPLKFCKKTVLGVSIYASLYNIGIQFCTDPILALSYIPSFIFGYVYLKTLTLILKR